VIYGLCLIRVGGEKIPVKGWPQVPEKFREYLLAKPVEATVVALDKTLVAKDPRLNGDGVVINAGRMQGLRVGMELIVDAPEVIFERVQIIKIGENHADAIVVGRSEPKVGWRVSTQAKWARKAQ
jgi:hypothetical protein